ncbi:MAG: alpha/beta fold hydrolase [Acidobacteriota bacterium]|nr:alpha/beta fold hydrolase [Acidobacteriota bacterium]
MLTDSSVWLRRAAAAEPAVRLLCFPHAGGGASSFNGWRLALPDWVELVKAQLPGREDRRDSPPHTRVEGLLPELFPHVETLLDRPLALYGHSMGALVAFEVARELRRRGHTPLALFVSGRRAPHRPLPPFHAMHDLPEQALVERVLSLGGMLPEVLGNRRWRDHYLPTIRADLRLSDVYTYRPEPGIECPLHAFLGRDDNLVVREDWERWEEVAAGEFTRDLLPGGHFFSREAQVELIAKLTTIIEGALNRSDAPAYAGAVRWR